MKKILLLAVIVTLFVGCKEEKKEILETPETLQQKHLVREDYKTQVRYAKGFKVLNFLGYKKLTITNPWPGADKEYNFAIVEDSTRFRKLKGFDGFIQVPLKSIVVTSTTHIPSLEMLGATDKLVGFPNLSYISSASVQKSIEDGNIAELGKNESINTEKLIELNPDVVITFAVDGDNKSNETIQKVGIPIIYNSDWTETTPLGKAEWIKFFGLLLGKEKTADSIFERIRIDYLSTIAIAKQETEKPTVLSGAMFKDQWYLPQGDSWAAQFITDANGNYLWNDTEGTGSSSLNIESVLDKGKDAAFWIGPGQFTSLNEMEEASSVYQEFTAFKKNEIYSFATKKGSTGGILYYELAPNRPDIVLKDMVKILHPALLPDHELFFFTKLE